MTLPTIAILKMCIRELEETMDEYVAICESLQSDAVEQITSVENSAATSALIARMAAGAHPEAQQPYTSAAVSTLLAAGPRLEPSGLISAHGVNLLTVLPDRPLAGMICDDVPLFMPAGPPADERPCAN